MCVGFDGYGVGNPDAQSDYSEWTSFMPETKRLDASADALGDNRYVFVPAIAEDHGKFLTAVARDDIYVACNSAIRCGLMALRSKLRCVYIDRAESREDVADGV